MPRTTTHRPRDGRPRLRRLVAAACVLLVPLGVSTALAPAASAQAPVGQGFTVTPSDLAFILKQIKIAERHAASITPTSGPCAGLIGPAADQIATPLLSYGLRTVDGSCNNLQPGRDRFAAADQTFPRLGTPSFKPAEPVTAALPVGPLGPTTYAQKTGNVVDSQPRVISNLIADQTSTNPAAVQVAGFPARTQGSPGVVPCTTDPQPLATPPVAEVPIGCTPSHQTLFIPNVTTDVGLSPPFNSWFTLFGQFFDHGLDFVSKSGGAVFVPLQADDPLIAGPDHVAGNADDLPASQRFMVLTRATNQPGPDGVPGNADDVQDGTNRDTPWIDQSQTYTSHASHQVFLRDYALNAAGRPVSTGRLLSTPDGGMSTWKLTKDEAAAKLGLRLVDADVTNIPMIATDPYGKFVPGPLRGLPQYVTPTGLVEGDIAAPVPVPANATRIATAFLDDIAHNAVPAGKTPDADTVVNGPAPLPAGVYDNEMLDTHYTAGDGRTNENIGLTAIHQVLHSEHDRLVADIQNTLTTDTSAAGVAALAEWKLATGAAGWNGERLFQAARFVNEMEYQHLVFEEFARKVQPGIDPFTVYHDNVNPAISAEFAHAVYRFGHSMLTDTISRFTENPDGTRNPFDVSLLAGFLNPPAFTAGPAGPLTAAQATGAIAMGMSDQVGNEIDEFVVETLRNNLLGLPLDLPTLNMARARETGVPTLNALRRQIFAATNDVALTPYNHWIDFGQELKNGASLVNFVAAYGKHPSITAATTAVARRAAAQLIVNPPIGADPATVPADAADFMGATGTWATQPTGIDDVDLWMGGLAERTNLFGGMLGSTFNYVFERQLTDLQNGDRLYYLARTPGLNLRTQLEGNSFAEMIMRNTTAHTLKADVFATADCKFELGHASFTGAGTAVADDPLSECNENALLIRLPDGTIRYQTSNTVDPPGINGQAVYNGTAGVNRVWGGVDNDTILGNGGNDTLQGGDGADVAIGGDGNDIITDTAGDDVPKGGPGNDAIDAGPGLDILMPGTGDDFTNGGANSNETFAGEGNDKVIAGTGIDTVFGDSGDDWVQGGDGQDLLCGDSCAPFFDDPNKPGHDVLIGQNGEEDYDAEGGDDIMIADAGIERNAGAGGFDWSTHERDTLAADADLNLLIAGGLPAGVLRDRYQEVEALSGGPLADTLRGDNLVPGTVGGAGFTGCDVLDQAGVNRVAGLNQVVTTLPRPLAGVVAAAPTGTCPLTGNVWGEGNILMGGAGADLIEGRGANDIIDGDRYLHVRLSVRTNPADPATQIGSADLMEGPYLPGSTTTLQQAVFAGTVDPGNIVIVREVLTAPAGTDVDVAQFSGPRADYDITNNAGVVTVVHARGTAADGTDTLRGVEQLRFSDVTISSLFVPAAPVIGTAVAGNAQATVNWTAPAVNGGSPVTSYQVVVRTGTTVVRTVTGIAPGTSTVVTGLTNGTAYNFQVRAVNAVGLGALSAASNVVTPAAPDTVRPTVTARAPGINAALVLRGSNITATFSEPVVNVTATTVTLRTTAGVLIPAVVTYNAATRQVTLNPTPTLNALTTYQVDLTAGIADAAGNTLTPVTWRFTTGLL